MNFKFKAYRHNLPKHFHFNRRIKVGILGGSFNPAHEGHLHVSFIAKKQLDLNQIMLMYLLRQLFLHFYMKKSLV